MPDDQRNRRSSPLKVWVRFHANQRISWGFFAWAMVVCAVVIVEAPAWWKVLGLVLLVDTISWQTYAIRRSRLPD
jgi:hypothetical protein